MIVRNATESDIDELLSLGRSMHEESRYKKFNYDQEKVRNLMIYLMNDDNGILIVAENDNKIIGGFMGMIINHYFGHDKSSCDFALFVDPESRNTKTAFMLIKEYIKQAKQKEVVDIGIGNTTGSFAVEKLYEKMGFVRIGGNYRLESN